MQVKVVKHHTPHFAKTSSSQPISFITTHITITLPQTHNMHCAVHKPLRQPLCFSKINVDTKTQQRFLYFCWFNFTCIIQHTCTTILHSSTKYGHNHQRVIPHKCDSQLSAFQVQKLIYKMELTQTVCLYNCTYQCCCYSSNYTVKGIKYKLWFNYTVL